MIIEMLLLLPALASGVASALVPLIVPTPGHAQPATTALPHIVSLNLCADPYLMAFAAPEQVLALTPNSRDPEQSPFAARAAGFPVTNGRMEDVIQLAPDLVILSPFSSVTRRQTFQRLGIETFTLNAANDFAAAREEILEIGAAIGRDAAARNYLADLDAQMGSLDQTNIPASLLNVQRRGLTAGTGHILDDIIMRAGAINLGRLAGDGMAPLSLEQTIMLAPDYLLLIGTPPKAADRGTELFAHPVLTQTYPPTRRITLPGNLILCAGASTPLAVKSLQAALADQRPLGSPK